MPSASSYIDFIDSKRLGLSRYVIVSKIIPKGKIPEILILFSLGRCVNTYQMNEERRGERRKSREIAVREEKMLNCW